MVGNRQVRHPCPCCQSATIGEPSAYEICEICGWEDDPVQSGDPNYGGGANILSLLDYRHQWRKNANRTSSCSPFESAYGFSRAVRIGNRIIVSGTAPIEADGSSTPGDAAAQSRRCFAIIVAAIEELGGSAANVVCTRMFITDPADADTIGAVHGEIFQAIRPAATMVVVSALLRPEWRIEIEAEALLGHESD